MIFHALFSSYPINTQPTFLPRTYDLSFNSNIDNVVCKHYVNPIRFWFYEYGIPKVAEQLDLPLHPWLKSRL